MLEEEERKLQQNESHLSTLPWRDSRRLRNGNGPGPKRPYLSPSSASPSFQDADVPSLPPSCFEGGTGGKEVASPLLSLGTFLFPSTALRRRDRASVRSRRVKLVCTT